MELYLDCRLDPEEQEYTEASLDFTKQEIMGKLDIVDVAKKLGIELQKLPKNSDEGKDYFSHDVYVGNCPCCSNGEGNLRIFSTTQNYGCLSCHWEGETYGSSMNMFRFLEHCGVAEDCFGYSSDDGDKERITKLFELFPEDLAHLVGRDLYQYTYSWDYFAEADKYYPGIKTNYEELDWRIKNVPKRNRVYEILEPLRQERGKLGSIIQSHAIVSKIYARQANIQAILFRRSISEVLGHEVEDEFAEGNMEIQSLILEESGINEDDMAQDFLEILQAEEQIEQDGIQAEKDAEVEKLRVEQEAEQKKQEELRIAQEKNPQELLGDLHRHMAELVLFSQERDIFFDSCEYSCIGEKDGSLSIGDFGKLVLVYEGEQKKFSVVVGSNKTQSASPKTIEAAKRNTYTSEMPSDVGNHKDINIPDGSKRFGGAQYIVLPENTILIGGQSGDYGSVSREIVEKCFKSLGYSVFFLDNTQYGSIDDVYRSVRRE